MPPHVIADPTLLELRIPLRLAVRLKEGLRIVPLWFEYREDSFWCASQADSLCVRALMRDPHCAFDLSTNEMPYRGLRGEARVSCLPEAGAMQLDRLLHRYLGGLESPLAKRLRKRNEREVALVIQPILMSHWDYAARMRGSVPHS